MMAVTERIAISEKELEERFVLSSGPGGQNVNKVATSVQLRFDAQHSPNLPAAVRHRLRALAGRRMTKDGVIVITASRFRSQERNREDALERLLELLSRAAIAPHSRRLTRPSRAVKERRLNVKKRRGALKKSRGRTRELE